ncbi:MAG TPA: SpoIID/LytB domain-containing protein, partial [Clostridia bacterium]|nr:SpoIID/LytB domain-containing protein [Clostridia bacterium]
MARRLKYITIILVSLSIICMSLVSFRTNRVLAGSGLDIRVLIKSIHAEQDTKSIYFTVKGNYKLNENESVTLTKGARYRAKVNGANVELSLSEQVIYTAPKITFVRLDQQEDEYLGLDIENPEYGKHNYLGKMEFSVSNGNLRLINTLDFELYLCGVVPYELGEGYPLETLKAQAISARSYAYNIVFRSRGTGLWDIVDTTENQVYMGYDPTKVNSIKAVRETEGIYVTYNDMVCQTFYSSSNGGQTKNGWSSVIPYCTIKDDPYDLNNPSSGKYSVILPTEISRTDPNMMLDARIESVLNNDLRNAVNPAQNVRITGIKSMSYEGADLKYPAPSREYANVFVRLSYVNEAEYTKGTIINGSGGTVNATGL